MKLFGKNPVLERLKAQPRTIRKIYFRGQPERHFQDLALRQKVPVEILFAGQFDRLSAGKMVQGVLAEVEEFKYTDLDNLLELSDKPSLLAVSNITDPQNLGSIIRTAACFGGTAVLIPRHNTVQVNETVLKVASGGENYVPMVLVNNLIPAIEQAKTAGYWIGGAVVSGGTDISGFEFPRPFCLVLGSEGQGIRKGLLKHLDYRLTLPMSGRPLSLNVAVAAAMFCYELNRPQAAKRSENGKS